MRAMNAIVGRKGRFDSRARRGGAKAKSVSCGRGLMLLAVGLSMIAAVVARGSVVKCSDEAAKDDDGKKCGGHAGIVEGRVARCVGT